MKANLKINAQYYENYNVGPEGFGDQPYWKPKGGHEFIIEGVDSDDIFYSDQEAVEAAVQSLLAKASSIAEKFELINYELVHSEPSKLSLEEFEAALLVENKNRVYSL